MGALATPAILPMLAMLAMRFPMLLPATPVFPPLPLSPPLLPLLPSLLSEELTLVPDVMSPTLLVLFMSPRGRLRLMRMLSMVPTVLDTLVSATLVLATLVSDMLAMLLLQLLRSLPSLLWPLLLLAIPVSPPLLL